MIYTLCKSLAPIELLDGIRRTYPLPFCIPYSQFPRPISDRFISFLKVVTEPCKSDGYQ